ncbi:hypothetical protein [Spiroplasma sp. Moj]|uniref:hypothetical protein n=1 Tax=Spiroplasma sp. Moj TaxID=1922342 RepID=UPI0039F0DFE5|nr:hypothetical protein [Spiroplasma sp. Moj]
MYEVKFKELQVRDSISGLIVVSNDLVAVKHMQVDLKDYFVTFIDILFAKQNYSMVDRHNSDFNDVTNVPDAVWNIIRTELNRLNITFFSKVVPYGNLPSLYKLTDNISKQYASVLLWAGEGYKPDKLTWQNFLYFFQRVQFPNGLISEEKYYVKANIASLNSCDFMIENLPLQNDKSEIVLKKLFKILMEKEPVDQKLTQFSQLIMDFWHYYKLETFNDKLVFHMSQVNFNALKQTIDSFASERLEFSNIELIFSSIFDYFNKRRTATIIADTHFSIWLPELHTFNLVKKSNSIIIEWFRKKVENVENLQIKINFGYNNFGYSFVPRLSIKDNNIHTGEYLRLDTFEFKIE